LDRFDPVIASLDKFEDVRYPETVARRGMTGTIDFTSPGVAAVSGPGSARLPSYKINVQDLDDLMKHIFDKSEMNFQAFTSGLGHDASEYLNR
jgi:hypothetical protein